MGRQTSALALAAALSALLCAGCIKVNVDVAVAPDRSVSARLAAAVDTSLAEMAEGGDAFSDLTNAAPKSWTTREYKEGRWTVSEAVGHAGPGETLFPDEKDGPKLQVQTASRRLSTRYDISLVTPPPPAQLAPPPKQGEGETETGPDLSGLATSMMSETQISISLAGPGEVVATTGEVVAPGKAEWKLAIADLQRKQALEDFRLTTELPNWLTIGRLADQLVMRGGPADAGSRLVSALQRGLLPNPPLNVAATDKLSAVDYLRLLQIIGKIDAGAGPAVTEAIVKQARLNDQDTTSARIAEAHGRIMKLDIGTLVEEAAIEAISGALR